MMCGRLCLVQTDSLFILHRTSSSSVKFCRKQTLKDLIGFRFQISDNQVHYEVVQIEIGKTRPFGARTESLLNLKESQEPKFCCYKQGQSWNLHIQAVSQSLKSKCSWSSGERKCWYPNSWFRKLCEPYDFKYQLWLCILNEYKKNGNRK